MKKYCIIGTGDVFSCEEHLKPEHAIEVSTTNPNPKLYVVSNDGTWVVNPILTYSEIRKIIIDGAWTTSDQLEAITEYLMDNTNRTKLDELLGFLKVTKAHHPKP